MSVAEPIALALLVPREAGLSDARELRRAMDAFLAGVEKRAYRVALAQLRDPDDALDAVQDAMFKLVRKYAARPQAEWAPLFWTILRSRVTDAQRRRSFRDRFRAFIGRDEDGEPLDPYAGIAGGAEPAAELAAAGALAALDAAVRALPARQREAFVLRVYEGRDVAETATAMACSEGSVKTHLSRAMHELRAVLEEHL
jgi:RNA polymerase sigma-70 factor (ECF subfamily)